MRLDRRALLTGSLATAGLSAISFPALGQPAEAVADFAAAASYSAERSGVSLRVMQGRQTLFEDYPRGGPELFYELASGTKSFNGKSQATRRHLLMVRRVYRDLQIK